MMERLLMILRNAFVRVRNDRRRQVILITGAIGLGIIIGVMIDGKSVRFNGREMALLLGGIFTGIEFCMGYQLEQDRRQTEDKDVEFTTDED